MLRSVFFVPLFLLVSAHAAAQHGSYRGGGDDREVQCSSRDYEEERCDVSWRDARLVRQLSNTRCERGRNWDIDRGGLWVNEGCSAVFVEAGRGDRGRRGRDDDWRPDSGWDQNIRVRCESEGYDYRMCRVDTGRGSNVFIDSRISKTACEEGENWGWNRAGIWVDNGCAAIFVVERRWR
jgi:hypothetical protein